jgi:hypothetical protein
MMFKLVMFENETTEDGFELPVNVSDPISTNLETLPAEMSRVPLKL